MRLSALIHILLFRRPRSGRATRTLFAIGVAVVLAACAKKDFKSEMGRTRSWTATTRLARERRELGATNGAVTAQLLQRARQARSKAERDLARLAKSDSDRMAARGILDSLHEGILRLQRVAR